MTIHEIAEKLNEMAVEEGFQIAELPALRKKYLNKKQLPDKIFTSHTIFDGERKYAFHYGGRDEMQFNFAQERDNGKVFSRYGICFSLKASHSLPDPVGDLEPFKKRFNQCIESHPHFFDNFEMWYHQDGVRHGNFPAKKIPDKWFQEGAFICVGNIIKKPLEELSENDLIQILKGFDNLLPVYKFCVLQAPSILSKEKRNAKVCWNENDWMGPSGEYGKSQDPKSHERQRGYGHEEWLFDFEQLVNGYHYALLQPVQKGRETFLNKIYDVKLYSHNSDTKENVWIGSIKNLEVISNQEAIEIYGIYKDKGWLDEMAQSIKRVKGDFMYFKTLKPNECFNIRFKPEDAILNKPHKNIENFDRTIGMYRYRFLHDKSSLENVADERKENKKRNFKFKSGKSKKSLANRVSTRQPKIVQSEPLHDKIQEILYDHLISVHGEENVGMETDTGISTRIDVSVNTPQGIILYEVKSFPSVMITIRAAIGQLLEYAYYPNPIKNLREMVIVSHIPIEQLDIEYLNFLRKENSLKISYQWVDVNKRTLSEKV